jgi:outer membrane protein, multidrug efflux system
MKLPRRLSFSALLVFGLASCALDSGKPFPDMPLPATWKNAGAFPVATPSRDLSRWWGRFDDPTAQPHHLRSACKDNPDLAAASARVRESRARRDAEYSTLFPSLSGSASSSSRSNRIDGVGSTSGTSYSAGLDASWEVDLFGETPQFHPSRRRQSGSGRGKPLNSVHAALAAEIASTYTNLRTNQARFEVLNQTVTTREETAQLATWRQQAGEADSLESSQALSSLESARAAIPSLKQAISEGRNQLALTLWTKSRQNSTPSFPPAAKASPNPPSSLAIGIPADTIAASVPDVRVAGYQFLAAAANTRAADAERYPSLNLTGSLGLNTASASQLLDPETTAANLIAGITSPIFDAGRIRANIEAASAVEEQAVQNYRSSVLTASNRNRERARRLPPIRRAPRSLEKATRLAREADNLARQRYEAGEIDFLEVLDSQRTLLNLEDNLLSTRTDRTTAYIRLYQALGGGW